MQSTAQNLSTEFYPYAHCGFDAFGWISLEDFKGVYCVYGSMDNQGYWVLVNDRREILHEGFSPNCMKFINVVEGDKKLFFYGYKVVEPQNSGSYLDYYFELYNNEGEFLNSRIYDDYGPVGSQGLIFHDNRFIVVGGRGIFELDESDFDFTLFSGPNYDDYAPRDAAVKDSIYILSHDSIIVLSLNGFRTSVPLDSFNFMPYEVESISVEGYGKYVLETYDPHRYFFAKHSDQGFSVQEVSMPENLRLKENVRRGGEDYIGGVINNSLDGESKFVLIQGGVIVDSVSVFDSLVSYTHRILNDSVEVLLGKRLIDNRNELPVIRSLYDVGRSESGRNALLKMKDLLVYNGDGVNACAKRPHALYVELKASIENISDSLLEKICLYGFIEDEDGNRRNLWTQRLFVDIQPSMTFSTNTIPLCLLPFSRSDKLCFFVDNLDEYFDDDYQDNLVCYSKSELTSIKSTEIPSLHIDPNPFDDWFQIVNPSLDEIEIMIFSSSGDLMYSGTLSSSQKFDTSDWPPGLYNISSSSSRATKYLKLVKSK